MEPSSAALRQNHSIFSGRQRLLKNVRKAGRKRKKGKKKKEELLLHKLAASTIASHHTNFGAIGSVEMNAYACSGVKGDPHVFHLGCCCIWLTSSLACWYCSFSLSGPTETGKHIIQHINLTINPRLPTPVQCMYPQPNLACRKARYRACMRKTGADFDACSAMLHTY